MTNAALAALNQALTMHQNRLSQQLTDRTRAQSALDAAQAKIVTYTRSVQETKEAIAKLEKVSSMNQEEKEG